MWLATLARAAAPPDVRKASGLPALAPSWFLTLARLSLAKV